MHARELAVAQHEAQAAQQAAAGAPAGRGRAEGEGPPTPRLGRLAGAIALAGGRRSPAGGPASRVAAESRAARPLGTAPGGMAGVVGVVNRYRRDRREPHRTPPLFQRLRREGPRGCRATLDATQWELALHTQDAQGAAEGLRRAPGQEGEGRRVAGE